MTPAAETPMSEAQSFNIAPIPATAGLGNPIKLAPGEPVPDARTLTDNTVDSTVSHDKENQKPQAQFFGVAPLPATLGAGNPIHLAPGEQVPDPSTFTSNTVQSTARTDPTSYAKSDAFTALPDLGLTPQAERDAKGGMFGLPPVMGNMIPESSLPMGANAKTEQDTGVTIQSAAPTSTTAELAGQVPKEPRGVPEIVSESRKEAGFAPEATSNPIAVLEKKEVEQELKDEVPEAPAAADNSYVSQAKSKAGVAAATLAAGATAGAGLFTAAAYSAKDKATEATGLNGSATGNQNASTAEGVPSFVSESQKEARVDPEASANVEAVREKSQVEQELLSEIPKTNETGVSAPAVAVPDVVSESQREAHVSPEAAANSEAVAEKKAVESELLREIPKTNEAGEPAPVLAAASSTAAPGAKAVEPASNVPDVVAESQREAHVSPEAAANSEAVAEKKAVESELLSEIPKANEAGEPAPVLTAATSTMAPGAKTVEPAANVPDVVAESHKEAQVIPEASANTEAVGGKKAVEAEMLEEVRKVTDHGEPAPGIAASSNNPAALSDDSLVDSRPLKSSSEPDGLNAPASEPALPATATAFKPTPFTSVDPTPFTPVEPTSSKAIDTNTTPAEPTLSKAIESDTTPVEKTSSKPIDSNTNVSFAPKEPTTTEQTQPTVTTGVETTTTEAKSVPAATTEASSSLAAPETPKNLRKDSDVSPKGTPGSQSIASAADDKKKKRRSIFGKIKDKLSSKN
jgi:hypothetical protein